MSTEVTQQKRIRLARALAPEDIRPGDYVTLLHYVTEVLPLAALVDTTWQTPKPIAVQWLPWGGGMPVRVLGVCLPFVLV
ncbi:MAG: hypothetical protein JXO22_17715, partial [Phycisphaerae bacterium]|nr:hypothetical protein [Phycisphaerae bacterium]